MLVSLGLVCVTAAAFTHAELQPRATTEHGVLVGKYSLSRYGRKFRSFEGIPYAKAPLGKYRFQEPQPLDESWTGEWNATSPGSRCLQVDHFTRNRSRGAIEYHMVGDEDCLFVNVFTAEGGPSKKNVLVLIHGGAFMFGSGNDYRPEYLMDYEDVVYVSLNYRLGPLGFLTTGDSIVPGNNGLKDQTAALRWVRRNIAAFGGDPDKVTIVGLSAGGASVHYQVLTPLSKGLFTKAYSYSGTTLCSWALVKDGVQKSRRIAALAGCPTGESQSMVNCLRSRPARQLVNLVKQFHVWLYNPYTVFGPVIEPPSPGAFISQHPRDILQQGKAKDVPWVSGVTSEDGLYPAADYIEDDQLMEQLRTNWNYYASNLLFFNSTIPVSKHSQVAQKIKSAYFGEREISMDTVKEVIQLMSDRLFIAPGIEGALLQARQNTHPVYLYMYRHVASRSVSQIMSNTPTLPGSCHGDDMSHIVLFGNQDFHVTAEDKRCAEFLADMLLTFAKTGHMPASLGWQPVTKTDTTDSFTYLDIKQSMEFEMRRDANIGNVNQLREILGDDKLPLGHDEL